MSSRKKSLKSFKIKILDIIPIANYFIPCCKQIVKIVQTNVSIITENNGSTQKELHKVQI